MSLSDLDRRAGARVRAAVGRLPGGRAAAAAAAGALAPAFRGLVLALLVDRPRRHTGVAALAAAVGAAQAAAVLRDRLGRPRPGSRAEGGLPSRHAAAAAAIVRTVGRRHPRAARPLALLAALGLAGRVAAAEHDPGDIAAGVLVGWAAAGVVRAIDRAVR
jgi:membrane-associated phospholipid phosphatase